MTSLDLDVCYCGHTLAEHGGPERRGMCEARDCPCMLFDLDPEADIDDDQDE